MSSDFIAGEFIAIVTILFGTEIMGLETVVSAAATFFGMTTYALLHYTKQHND